MLGGPTYKVRLLTVVMALMFLNPRANADAKGKPGAQILIRNPGEPGSKPFPGFVPVKPEPDSTLFQTAAAEHRFADRDELPVHSEETHLEPVKRKTVQPVSRLRSKADTVPEPGDKEIEPVRRTRFRTKAIPRKIVLKRRKVKKFRKRPRLKPSSDSAEGTHSSDMLKNQILDTGVALAPEAQRGGSLAELAFATLTAEEQKSESQERPFPRNRDIQIMKTPKLKNKSSTEKDTAVSASRLRTRPQAASRLRNNVPESSNNKSTLRNSLFGDRKRFKGIIRKETRRKAKNIIGASNKPSFFPTRQSLVIKAPDSPFPNFPANKGGEVDIEVQIQEERDGRAEDNDNSLNIGFEELTLNPRQNLKSDFEIETFMPILRPEAKERQRFSAVSAVPDINSQPANNPIQPIDEGQFSDFLKIPQVNQIDNDPFQSERDPNRSPIRGEPLPITQFFNPNLPIDVQSEDQPKQAAPEQVPAFPNIFNNPNPKARRRRPQIQNEITRNTAPLNTPQIQPITQLNTLPTPQPIFQSPTPVPPTSFQDIRPQSILGNQSPTPQSIFPNQIQSFPHQPSNFPSFPGGSILPAIAPVRPLPNPRVVPVRPLPNPRIVPQNTNQAKQPNLLSPQFPPILREIPESPAATPLVPVGGVAPPVNQGILNLGSGGLNSHTETRVGNSVQGQYSYTAADGTVKVVSYKTDGPNSLPQITHTTEAPQSIHHQTSPHSIQHSASHLIHHPTQRPVVHGSNSPIPIQQPVVTPAPHSIPALRPIDPAFSVRHHGTTVVPRKRVTEPPIQAHPSSAPQHSAKLIQHPPQVPPHPTPVNIFKPQTQPHSSAQFQHFANSRPHASPIPPHSGPTSAPHHGQLGVGPSLAPHIALHHGPTQGQHHGPTQVQHHGPTQAQHHGPTQAQHHGPTHVQHHGPSLAPQHHAPQNHAHQHLALQHHSPQHVHTQAQPHRPPQHRPTPAPHHGPPHHGPTLNPIHGPPQHASTFPHPTPFVHHGPSKAPHSPAPFNSFPSFFSPSPPHFTSSPTPGHAILPSFTPSSPHQKRPRYLPHPPIYLVSSPTPFPTHPSPYPSPAYHGGHVPNPSFPINHHSHPQRPKVPSLTFFPTASPIPSHPIPQAHPIHIPSPSPHISVHPGTNRPTVHHPKPTPFPFASPTPTPGLRVVTKHYPSPSPVPLLYQPNRIVFTPKPFIHTSVRPVAIHHSTPAPFHGSSRAPILHTTPQPIFKSTHAPIYQPATPVPLHLRTPMTHHVPPHPSPTSAPFFTPGPTPTPSHFFFSTPYPITPYPPLKYSPTPPPTPYIVPANFPSNGHGFPAHIPVATARSKDIEHEVPEIAQESVNNISVAKAPPKNVEKNGMYRSDDKILKEIGDNKIVDEKQDKDALKRSIHTQRRNPKKYRTSRNYRHFYEKT